MKAQSLLAFRALVLTLHQPNVMCTHNNLDLPGVILTTVMMRNHVRTLVVKRARRIAEVAVAVVVMVAAANTLNAKQHKMELVPVILYVVTEIKIYAINLNQMVNIYANGMVRRLTPPRLNLINIAVIIKHVALIHPVHTLHYRIVKVIARHRNHPLRRAEVIVVLVLRGRVPVRELGPGSV